MTKLITATVITTFVLLAVFGVFLPAHIGHTMGCPLTMGETALCPTSLSHIGHWKSAFTAILGELLLLIAIAIALSTWFQIRIARNPRHDHYALQARVPVRPTLFQELFARGILNRKEPPLLLFAIY